ncbi:MAG: UDP-N-acetylmuramoyl-L-alanine--D-glutamate ligase [Candidatus Omnitrophica bacterium]|nr:UDP-N-acetylmuramoyl-L-alanine--D-glutamate ligase [Candidatus Omnitrophota bacterium]MDD5352794.1 UDP-N-acetylmuramoyl-L-alanine--D-glutamate ligase [Candidatus Omnitrophota bacterium]MDD5550393.1 UDP-N-acetylmuramoyl-L-alanine--D-glutamate ligase [Candidatus Omnitrophota bacterium]
MINFKDKNVVVLGLGCSGLASAKLLKGLGAKVFVSDRSDDKKQREYTDDFKKLSIDFELGRHTKAIIEKADYMVISPGVPCNSEAVEWAKKKNIEIIGEMELGYQHCPAKIIATTGTNGKTTVTTLIGRVLEKAGKKVFILGNIGTPLCSCVEQMQDSDFVSLEVSSFQLETIQEFRPKVSLILNFTPDHLDRYKNLAEYLEAKKRVFLNQNKDDFVILNYKDKLLRSLAKETRAKVLYFADGSSSFDESKFNPNQLAVLKVAEVFNIGLDVCQKVFKDFKGIEHRMEFVRSINGIDFVNDSKATNVESTIWGLENSTKPVVLLAGGRDKGSDFSTIGYLIKEKVKSLVLFGEAKTKIKNSLSGVAKITEAKDIYEAVDLAFKEAKAGDCVLLSPMCASFDMFSNYKERGNIFKQAVNNLESSCKVSK